MAKCPVHSFRILLCLPAASGVAPSAPATEGQKSAEAGAGAHVVSAFAPEVTVKPVSSAADAGGNKPALEKPQTVEVRCTSPSPWNPKCVAQGLTVLRSTVL